jgi:hypothetical protein
VLLNRHLPIFAFVIVFPSFCVMSCPVLSFSLEHGRPCGLRLSTEAADRSVMDGTSRHKWVTARVSPAVQCSWTSSNRSHKPLQGKARRSLIQRLSSRIYRTSQGSNTVGWTRTRYPLIIITVAPILPVAPASAATLRARTVTKNMELPTIILEFPTTVLSLCLMVCLSLVCLPLFLSERSSTAAAVTGTAKSLVAMRALTLQP